MRKASEDTPRDARCEVGNMVTQRAKPYDEENAEDENMSLF
jgi:hypothetical protein